MPHEILQHPSDYNGLSKGAYEREYSPRETVDDFMHFINIGHELGKKAYADLECVCDQHYASSRGAVLDYFPAPGANNPIAIIVHGGFWRALNKEQHAFAAPVLVGQGISTVVVDYALAPEVSVSQIVEQVQRAILWVYQNAHKLNGDPNKIYLSGSSAGGHLCAMALQSEIYRDNGLPENLIKGACLFSGLYDLEPLLYCRPNSWLGLTLETAQQNSPIHHLPDDDLEMLLIVGEHDTEAFKQQTRLYANRLQSAGLKPAYKEIMGRNHFDVFVDLAYADTWVTQQFLRMIKT